MTVNRRALRMIAGAVVGLAGSLPIASASVAQVVGEDDAGLVQWSAGLTVGYRSGIGIKAIGMVSGFTPSFPVTARFGIGYTAVDAGEPLAARSVFINDATNGVPQESGHAWSLELDVLYPVRVLSLSRSQLYGGIRHARFNGNFEFIGGNEDFDVTSNNWGVGAGLESYLAMSRRVDLLVSAGVDYFFSSRLSGHDTSYSPDETNVNPRNDYTYSDADAAVGQPKLEPLLMFGFRCTL
jgi:hypothetical protein